MIVNRIPDLKPLPSVCDAYARITGLDPRNMPGRPPAKDTIAVPCVSKANHKHGDATPSLHIQTVEDVWTCRVCRESGGKSTDLVIHAGLAKDRSEAAKWLVPPELPREPPKAVSERRLAATYPYVDPDGKVLYEVQRFEWSVEGGGTAKDFKQRRPTPGGGWSYSLDGVERVPYRWPEMVAAMGRGETIYVVEGEKTADAGNALGLPTTTSAQGTNWRWTREFLACFAGAISIVVIGDNDDPGASAAKLRAEQLSEQCGNVRLVERMPGVGLKGDFVDWIENNPGADRRKLKRALADVAVLIGGDIDDGSMRVWSFAALHDRIIATQKPAKMGIRIGIRAIDEALYGLQPGETTILAARSGHSKTSVAQHIACNVWDAYKVLFVSLEMGARRTHDTIIARYHGMPVAEYRLRGRPSLPGDAEWFANKKLAVIGRADAATADAIIEKVQDMRPDLLIVDHLREVADWHDRSGKVRGDVAAAMVMSKLMTCAVKYGHHNLLLSQVGRDAEGGRPELSDLRDSGSVEEKADNVIMLYRPFKSVTKSKVDGTADQPEDDVIEVILRKAREAEEMFTLMRWDGPSTSIAEPSTLSEVARVRRHLS